jgi:AcrR family transcriptional regulator
MATQEERKAQTRALLLDAAADLFARKGVHAVSVDAVAEAAGRTSGALYAHFGGKEGLLAALVERWSREAAARISAEALADAPDLDGRLLAVWHGWAGDGDERASWSQLEHELWLEATRRPEVATRVADRFAAARSRTGEGLTGWREEDAGGPGRSRGGARAESPAADAEEVGALALALLYGLEMQRRVDPAAVPDDLVVRGLRALLGRDD